MRIIIYCPFTQAGCGGVKVIAEWASRLLQRGHNCEWWSGQAAPVWFPRLINHRSFPNLQSIIEAMRAESNAVIIATWWESAFPVSVSLRNGSRGFYLCQDIDELTYGQNAAGNSYRLGLHCITEGEWVTQEIQRRYNITATNVGIGLDHTLYGTLPIDRDRNLILTTYRPQSGPNDLKGWSTAYAVARAVYSLNPQSTLVTFGMDRNPPALEIPHKHIRPTDFELRKLYCKAGCYLMTSRHEGFCLPAAEAMQCGTPVVCTDAHGNMEFCKNKETALVGDSVAELTALVRHTQTAPVDDIAEAGRKFVLRYNWNAVMDRVEQCLK